MKENNMPYIKNERRKVVDKIVQLMKELNVKADGDLNYILYKFCKYNVPLGYNSIKNFCGELRQCATEIERRILADYEQNKIFENGDVTE